MSRYTTSLYNFFKNQVTGETDTFDRHYTDLFNFNFNFYNNSASDKNDFIEQFCQYYLFDEVAFETIQHFKIKLQNRLNLIMPKYSDLWHAKETIDNVLNGRSVVEHVATDNTSTGSSNTESSSHSTASATDSDTFENDTTTESSGTAGASDKNTVVRSDTPTIPITSNYYAEKSVTDVSNSHTTSDTSTAHDESARTQSRTSQGDDASTNSVSTSDRTQGTSDRTVTETNGTYADLSADYLAKVLSFNTMIIEECADLFMQIL